MNENSDVSLKESISALVDGESNDFDLQKVLNASKESSSQREVVRGKWASYQAISSSIKGEQTFVAMDISARVGAALENEPTITMKPSPSQWVRNVVGKTAVAASVALAVVVGFQQYSTVTTPEANIVANHTGGAVIPEGFELPDLSARTVSAVPESISATTSAYSLQGASQERQVIINRELMRKNVEQFMRLHQGAQAQKRVVLLPNGQVVEVSK